VPKFAFEETDDAMAEITRLYDFIWPTALALWNLRWQVDGYMRAAPDASYSDFQARFAAGSDIRGADVRSMIAKTTWDEQKGRFAEVLLTNLFAIYENWADLLTDRVTGFKGKDLAYYGNGTSDGVLAFLAAVNKAQSQVMSSCFKSTFERHKDYHLPILEEMLKCYRYFKEIRNCLAHKGAIADQRVADSYASFQPVSSAASLKTKETIQHSHVVVGQRVDLSLRGVVGFSAIMRRLMVSIDAAISGSSIAEQHALERLRQVGGPRRVLNARPRRQQQQVSKVYTVAGLPAPLNPAIAQGFLLQHRLISR